MASDLGKSYKLKKIKINYPNGDVYEGMGAAYYNPPYEPHGIGRYYQKSSGITFEADWEWREGPDFKSIRIINKPLGKSFVILQVYAGEIYSDLVHLDIIEAKEGEYAFKDLPSIILEPHSWSNHLFRIKKVTDNELTFDFVGPKVDHGKFIDFVAPKGEVKKYESTVSSTIIWDHGDEYDVTQNAKIEILYF